MASQSIGYSRVATGQADGHHLNIGEEPLPVDLGGPTSPCVTNNPGQHLPFRVYEVEINGPVSTTLVVRGGVYLFLALGLR